MLGYETERFIQWMISQYLIHFLKTSKLLIEGFDY
jgi:hypothetical protein